MKDKNELINQIVQDLLNLDRSFSERELRSLVERLAASRPLAKLDQNFAEGLKAKVLERFDELKSSKSMKGKIFSLPKIDWRTMSYISASSAALVLLAVVVSSMGVYKQNSLSLGKVSPSLGNQIVKVGSNAFGPLVLARNANQGNLESISKSVNNDYVSNSPSAAPTAPAGLGGSGAVSSKIMTDSFVPPMPSSIKYVYSGDDFELPSGQVTVYRKVPPVISDFSGIVSAIKGLNAEGVDVSKLRDLKLDSLSIKEDREFGYYLSISPSNNVFYMSKNWERWPNPGAGCQDDKCWQDVRVKASDVPSDEETLNIAKAFIEEYGIKLDGYGQPLVQNSWRNAYASYPDKESYYFPDEVYVIYPLLIDGVEVRGQGGEFQGLMVNVDVRSRKASGFNGSIAPSFESSAYDSISDKETLKKMAEDGGMNGRYYYYADAEGKESTVELETPRQILMQYWKYDQGTGRSDELYIPALIFPVKSKPADNPYFYTENIVVPLIKDVLQNNDYPILMKGGALIEPTPLNPEADSRPPEPAIIENSAISAQE
jgi:hypothetical protein